MKQEYEEGEISESEQFLFIRNESESNNDDDEWDDSQLIKEYDRAVAKAKRQVMRKIQGEMALSRSEIQEVFSDCSSKKKKKNKKKKSKHNELNWTAGSACRAIYSEDGKEYEAEILKIIDSSLCIVNFIGYDNEEQVLLSQLTPSLGKDAIDIQIIEATLDQAASEEVMDTEENNASSDCQNRRSNVHKNMPPPPMDPRLLNSLQRPPMMDHCFPPPPPPPPPPPTMGRGSFSKHPVPMGDEALNSMLMSWYMCGYYTGYYQRAMKDC